MKLNNISLPYPVLGVNDDISPALKDDAIVIRFDKNDIDSYILSVALKIENEYIVELINNGYACYICEIDCPKTNFRTTVESQSPEYSFTINRRFVFGNVFLNCYVAVVKPINGYDNPGFHDDYKGFKFNLTPGDILVGFPARNFVADLKFDKLQSATSFMQIRQDEYNEFTNFEFTDRTIDIKLPTELFNIYNSGVGQSFYEVIHSSLAYNALLGALYEINSYKQSIWAQALIKLITNDDELLDAYNINDNNIIEFNDITKVATHLLRDPYNRMLHKLDSITSENSLFDE